ncbi:MAG: VanZ family protein [Eggerthellaceae bacterium]|nr:VanZ family protein [Eggerthellaceae bacterium]
MQARRRAGRTALRGTANATAGAAARSNTGWDAAPGTGQVAWRTAFRVSPHRRPFQMERPAGFLGSRALTGCLFAVYLAFLAWIVLLKGQFSLDVAGTMRSVNLVPLAGATVINGAADYREAVENLVAFVPFGLYLGMLAGRQPLWRGIAAVAAVSLGFEVLQFAFAMGASDVTDLIANTAGGALGLGLYALARRAFRSDGRALRWCNAAGLACTLLVLALTALLVAANG